MFGIGAPELLIVGIVAVILFGNRLPEVARSLGKSLNEFKKGMQELENEVKTSIYSEPPTRSANQDRLPSPPLASTPAESSPTATIEPPRNETVSS